MCENLTKMEFGLFQLTSKNILSKNVSKLLSQNAMYYSYLQQMCKLFFDFLLEKFLQS